MQAHGPTVGVRSALTTLLVMSVMVGGAHAQSGVSRRLAVQLFNEARDLVKQDRWAEACPKFEASLHYDPALGTRLNLAACFEHIGKLASAWGHYRELIELTELAKTAEDKERRAYAQRQAAKLEPQLARLTIFAPATPPAGLVVMRDGTQLEPGALGIALYVDAGAHEITASAPGFEAFAQTITLVDGKAETVKIPALSALKAKPEPPRTKAIDPPKPVMEHHSKPAEPVVRRPRARMYVALGVGAAGLAAVGAGLALGAKASATYEDATALCGADLVCSPANYDEGKQLVHDARSSATTSTVLVIAGGAAIVAGAVVALTAPRAPRRATARIMPVLHDRGAGLAITGGF